jgi:hypothetical protein
MPVNINGYALSNSSGLSFGASGTKVVAANYGIVDPLLPGMMGSATAAGPYKAFPFVVNDVNVNIGSPWSVSTYAFTAPAAGVYYTSYGGIVGNGASQGGYYALIINGGVTHFSYRDSNAQWELHHVEVMFRVAAGDTIQWAMNAAPGPDSSTAGGAYTSNHNICTIWLVG